METGFDQRTQGPLALRFAGITQLQASYMPYLRRGGLFIATGRRYRLGDPVAVSLGLADHFEQLPVHGEVAWITPPGAQGNRMPGVGIQFSGDEAVQNVRALIEGLLTQHGLPTVTSNTM